MPEVTPVGLYPLLPTPGFVHAHIPPGAAILDLGNSGGGFANPLAELGHPVLAVDDSPAMLSPVRGARTVQSDPATLDLGERFPVVLGRHHPHQLGRRRSPHRPARHLPPPRQPSSAGCRRRGSTRPRRTPAGPGPVEVSFEIESFDGTVLHSRTTYRLDAATWQQRTSARRLTRAHLHAALATADLRFDRHLHGARQCFSAVPAVSAVPLPDAADPSTMRPDP